MLRRLQFDSIRDSRAHRLVRCALLMILLTAACASNARAPIAYGSSRQAPAVASSAPRDAPAPGAGDRRPEPGAASEAPRSHRVAAGETAYDIAARYQIPLDALLEANRLSSAAVRPGLVLTVPGHQIHVAAPGETLRDIANAHDVDPRSLALLNRLGPEHVVQPGDRVLLPFAAHASAQATPAQAEAPMVWPLRGSVGPRFGARAAGVPSDALEIAGQEGALVVAAAGGEVIYAGEDLEAYGVLVLVRHEGDLVSTYGYLRRALVRAGQRIAAGEPLGELGARPNGDSRLLFQVRRHGRPVDPEPLLPPPG